MSAGIFINYRREDSIATAGRLNDRLTQAFGKNRIFMDVDHIPVGADFISYIEHQLANCAVLLAVIGPNWLNSRDDDGLRRLDDPKDLVSREIEIALHRGVSVIPILVDRATMPSAEELPEALKAFARRNATELRNIEFSADADRLIEKLADLVENKGSGIRRWRFAGAGAAALALLLLLGWGILTVAPIAARLFDQTSAVEKCDKGLGSVVQGLDYSGIFRGVVIDAAQTGADVELKLVRNGDEVTGSYLRAGMCGSISGRVEGGRLVFNWKWAGSKGRGTAALREESLSGTTGLGHAIEGGGTFVLFRKNPDSH
jgi:hypothetical protein